MRTRLACILLLVAMFLPASAPRADGYFPNAPTSRYSGLSGQLRGDITGRIGGFMPISPDMGRVPVSYSCGVCRSECEEKWYLSCGPHPGCRRELRACLGACWYNACRGGR
jgi:hypothetical protein